MALGQPVNHFDRARERASQRANTAAQTGGDALKRRFASLGGMNSGAAIKAQQLNDESANRQREEAIQGVDAAEAQDVQRRGEMDRQYAEADKGRAFAAGEAEKGRAFQKAHNDLDRQFQDKVFAFDSKSKLRALDQADAQFGFQKDQAGFNQRLEKYKAGQSGGLFGGGGFLGLGFGAGPADI